MIIDNIAPFLPCEFRIKFAASRWEREGAYTLRRAVFCEEQRLFRTSDRDETDEYAIPIVALSMLGVASDRVVGTVRIHEEAPRVWWGSRLAVESGFRRVGAIGATLIRLAVSSAHAMGCATFLAHVQEQNEQLFQQMSWRTVEAVDLHGRRHFKMQADLSAYPPCATPELGYVALRKAA
jgi:putative N-acetyltransferase (TIGR04045 family)